MWPWGSLDTPPRGLSHATPLGGCCVTVYDPSPAHAGGSCLPCQGVSPTKWQICLVYLDDVIIFSASAEQHVKDVDVVLTRFREAGVTLNLENCTWFSDEVEYLGHIVGPGQLHVHNKNVDALKHASFPTTKTQL